MTGFYTSPMALSIKSDEADRLARELAARTGETLTEAVVVALRERLARQRTGLGLQPRLVRLADEVAALPVLDDGDPDRLLGYDDLGLPR